MKKYRHKTNGSTMTYKDGCMRIENLVVEGEPNLNYWEEVVEQEYEILSYECLNRSGECSEPRQIFHKEINGLFTCNKVTLSEEGIKRNFYEKGISGFIIHSIKRLSDGEIFTVGNFVNFNTGTGICYTYSNEVTPNKSYGRHCKITSIKVSDNKLKILTDYNPFYYSIDSFSKIKHILTTEDGVKVIEGIYVFSVSKNFSINKNIAGNTVFKDCLVFSTKEKAEEYILENKPCLSIAEIKNISAVTDNPFGIMGVLESKLLELVKQKICQ